MRAGSSGHARAVRTPRRRLRWKGFNAGYHRICARSPRRSRHLSLWSHSNLLAHGEQLRHLRNFRSSRRTTTAPWRSHPTLRRAHHGRHSPIAVATDRHHVPNAHRSLLASQGDLYLPPHCWSSATDPISARRTRRRRRLERYAPTSRRSPSLSRFRRHRSRQTATDAWRCGCWKRCKNHTGGGFGLNLAPTSPT